MKTLITLFVVLTTIGHALCQSNITEAEYFINQDPGYGNATSIDITAMEEVTIDESILNNLPTGLHSFTLRAKNENGEWGLPYTQVFYHQMELTSEPQDHQIAGYEYFIGNDPGIGEGIFVSTEENTEVVITDWLSSLGLTTGTYNLGMRAQTNYGIWGLVSWVEFEFLECENETIILEGPEVFCSETGTTISAPAGYDAWAWNTNESTESIEISESGEYQVSVYLAENHQCFHSNPLEIDSETAIDPEFEISISFNSGGFDCNLEAHTYLWEVDGSEVGSEALLMYEFEEDGSYEVCMTASNSCGSFQYCENVFICSQVETAPYFYLDNDEDGYGSQTDSIQACQLPLGYASNGLDCDDNIPEINPDAQEIEGDGIDQNCDGEDFVVSTKDFAQLDFNVYPNPGDNYFNIGFQRPFEGSIELVDLRGRILLQKPLPRTTQYQLPIDGFESGMYILRIRSGSNMGVTTVQIL